MLDILYIEALHVLLDYLEALAHLLKLPILLIFSQRRLGLNRLNLWLVELLKSPFIFLLEIPPWSESQSLIIVVFIILKLLLNLRAIIVRLAVANGRDLVHSVLSLLLGLDLELELLRKGENFLLKKLQVHLVEVLLHNELLFGKFDEQLDYLPEQIVLVFPIERAMND